MESTCTADSCDTEVHAFGLCHSHYTRARYRGLLPPRRSVSERLAARLVVSSTGCLEWTGQIVGGYGAISVSGKSVKTHRLAWELANGPIPDDLCVLHRCDNPPCCNVEHLFLGTRRDNNRDMAAKGRHRMQARTHCPQGHPYDSENTYPIPSGGRGCRTCRRRRRS